MNTLNRFRKTKIVATIGPACEDEDTLAAMIEAGMNVARFNLSHGSGEAQGEKVERVRNVARRLDANLAVMADTRGREIRTKGLTQESVDLVRGQEFTLYCDESAPSADGIGITHPTLHEHVNPGETIMVDDGLIELKVTGTDRGRVECEVLRGGMLKSNKGVNLPENSEAFDALVSDDDRDIEFAARHRAEYIAASFVRNDQDVSRIRDQLKAMGASIPIIAKIESRRAVENLESIIQAANGIMVARGDLGVEMHLAQGPTIQKRIIYATVNNGKPVITATQMLDSMERNPRPTRAEVSDVANAILDGSSAVMLSGETAAGRYPVEAVRTMAALALEAESGLREFGHLQQTRPSPSDEVTEAIAQASITMADHLKAQAIIALTETGRTARLISKYRPDCPILAITSSAEVSRRLALNWGVLAVKTEEATEDEDKIRAAIESATALGYVAAGGRVVATAGSSRVSGSTDLIRVISI